MNLTRNHEVAGSIPGLAQWVKYSALRWLWYSLEATVLMLPLTWESPYAAGEALKNQQNKTKQKTKCVMDRGNTGTPDEAQSMVYTLLKPDAQMCPVARWQTPGGHIHESSKGHPGTGTHLPQPKGTGPLSLAILSFQVTYSSVMDWKISSSQQHSA